MLNRLVQEHERPGQTKNTAILTLDKSRWEVDGRVRVARYDKANLSGAAFFNRMDLKGDELEWTRIYPLARDAPRPV